MAEQISTAIGCISVHVRDTDGMHSTSQSVPPGLFDPFKLLQLRQLIYHNEIMLLVIRLVNANLWKSMEGGTPI